MNINSITAKLGDMAKQIEADKGPLYFLALLFRDDIPDLWEFAVGAKLLHADQRSSYAYAVDHLRASLTSKEFQDVARVVILDRRSGLESFLDHYGGQSGIVDIPFVTPGGPIIPRAYIAVADATPLAHANGSANGAKTRRNLNGKSSRKTRRSPQTRKATA